MSGDFERLEKKQTRGGMFNNFRVQGIQYETSTGEPGWLIKAWPDRDPVHNYWVKNGRFYGVKVDILPILISELQIEKFDEVQDVPEEERKAVLSAITEWGKLSPGEERNEGDDLPKLQ